MWCDWQAAVRRHKDGNIENSIRNNKDRFSMDRQFVDILYNQKEINYGTRKKLQGV
jgi:hypothetical protein